tara:strand:- start:12939 stop:13130 length:192 start_codon:yes stop_codon:yes gene_type:complete
MSTSPQVVQVTVRSAVKRSLLEAAAKEEAAGVTEEVRQNVLLVVKKFDTVKVLFNLIGTQFQM